METISNISSAASKAIWGEGNTSTTNDSGTEPVSGEQGKGTVNDPFDHGNEEQNTTASHDTTSGTNNTSAETTGSETVGSTGGNINQPPSSGVDTSSAGPSGPSNAVAGDQTGDPSSGVKPKAKQQGADKPTEAPKTDDSVQAKMPHSDEERERLMMKGEFPHDPNDHSGEPLKMHSEKAGGDVGDEEEEEKDEEGKPIKKDRSQSVAQEGGAPHGASKGTGQEYVKSSGMAADGGDFDATKPGAGSEANRLLEEKGVHKDGGNKGPPVVGDDASTGSGNATGTPKVSKMEKLKEKLHIGKK